MAKDEFGLNKNNIATEDDSYVETLVVNGKMVNIFASDSGQCFWFQFLNDEGELESCACGTYNTEYMSEIEEYFKPEIKRLSELVGDLRIKCRDLEREIIKLKKKK